jgi:hypothetical protein
LVLCVSRDPPEAIWRLLHILHRRICADSGRFQYSAVLPYCSMLRQGLNIALQGRSIRMLRLRSYQLNSVRRFSGATGNGRGRDILAASIMFGLAASGYATICYAEAPKEPLHVVELSTLRPRMCFRATVHHIVIVAANYIGCSLFESPASQSAARLHQTRACPQQPCP